MPTTFLLILQMPLYPSDTGYQQISDKAEGRQQKSQYRYYCYPFD